MTVSTAPDSRRQPQHRIDFTGIGTSWSISTHEPLEVPVRERIAGVIESYDATWSRFRPDSLVSRIAPGGRSADFGVHCPPLMNVLSALAVTSAEAMTPLIGGPLEHLGYDASYRMRPRAGWRAAPPMSVLHRNGDHLTLDEPAVLDVGSAGKGQLIDLVSAELTAAGHYAHLVDGGRDLYATGQPVVAALEHPLDETRAIGTVEIRNAALSGSATNRRSWNAGDERGRLHHVLDGRTGRPVQHIAATWVLGRTALLADALSTALFFVEPHRLASLATKEGWGSFDYVVMTADGVCTTSAGFPGEIFR